MCTRGGWCGDQAGRGGAGAGVTCRGRGRGHTGEGKHRVRGDVDEVMAGVGAWRVLRGLTPPPLGQGGAGTERCRSQVPGLPGGNEGALLAPRIWGGRQGTAPLLCGMQGPANPWSTSFPRKAGRHLRPSRDGLGQTGVRGPSNGATRLCLTFKNSECVCVCVSWIPGGADTCPCVCVCLSVSDLQGC